jgi:hypothetical protein
MLNLAIFFSGVFCGAVGMFLVMRKNSAKFAEMERMLRQAGLLK